MLTLGNILFLVFGGIFLFAIFVVIGLCIESNIEDDKAGIICGIVLVIVYIAIMVGTTFFLKWYNTNTASGIRAVKDYQSEINNGINREIIITAEDGRQIFYYEGKVDVESNHTDNYIKFESEDGRRYIIYYGIQDTIQIIEKAE